MKKRIIILSSSEIKRKGLNSIIKGYFNIEVISLNHFNQTRSYDFCGEYLVMIIDEEDFAETPHSIINIFPEADKKKYICLYNNEHRLSSYETLFDDKIHINQGAPEIFYISCFYRSCFMLRIH